MTLRTALIVSGDTESAQRAVAEMDAAVAKSEAQLTDYQRAYHKTDAAIAELARAQAEATREIEATRAAYKAGEISLEQYNRELLETKTGLGLIEADYRKARSEMHKFAAANDNVGQSAKFGRHHLSNLSYQIQDIVIAAQMGQDPLQIFLQQGGQIGQIMGDAGVGVGGLTKEIGRMAIKFAPAIIAVGAGTGAIALLRDEVSKGLDTDAIIDGLNLTEKQLERIENRSLTFGDVIGGVWDAMVDDLNNKVGTALDAMGLDAAEVFEWIVEAAKRMANGILGWVTLVPRVLAESWSLIPSAASDIFISAANAGIGAIEALVQGAAARINGFLLGINQLGLFEIDLMAMPQFKRLENQTVGAAGRLGDAAGRAFQDTFQRNFIGEVGDAASPFIAERQRNRLLEEAGDPETGRTGGQRGAGRLSDEEREFKRRFEETQRFIDALREEIEAIGLDERALRQLEIQRAKETAATSDQVRAIDELNERREKALALEESRQRAAAARESIKGIEESIGGLEREAQALGSIGWEREKLLLRMEYEAELKQLLQGLSQALAAGYEDEAAAIRAQIDALQMKNALEIQIGDASEVHREQADAAERNAESYRHLGRSAAGALSQIAIYGEGASGVMKRLALSIADAFLQANLLGEGPLAGIFGGGGGAGGLIGSLLGAIGFGGGRASGGPVSPGQIYAVNERSTAPGFFLPVGPGRIEPPSNDNPAGGGRGGQAAPVYFDMRGAVVTEDLLRQAEQIARSTSGAMIGRYDSELPDRIDAHVARSR
ncbi:phage tail length tape measure family protein [Citromicrobium bathyomarinum]